MPAIIGRGGPVVREEYRRTWSQPLDIRKRGSDSGCVLVTLRDSGPA